MVYLNYKIQCNCGHWQTKYTQSGDSDKWISPQYDCGHWTCWTWQQTTLGWLFGGNAQVKFKFQPKCSKCGQGWRHIYSTWGWNSGCHMSQMYKCCGNSLLITCTQDGWWQSYNTYALAANIIQGNVIGSAITLTKLIV